MTQLPDHLDDVPPGWIGILHHLHKQLLYEHPKYEDDEVKRQFGRLRVKLTDETPEMLNLIANAEDSSGRGCEDCGRGAEGVRLDGEWYTLCSTHQQERLMVHGNTGSDGEGG